MQEVESLFPSLHHPGPVLFRLPPECSVDAQQIVDSNIEKFSLTLTQTDILEKENMYVKVLCFHFAPPPLLLFGLFKILAHITLVGILILWVLKDEP